MLWICQLLAFHPLHLLILTIIRRYFFPPGFGHFHIIMNYDRDTRQSDFKPVSPWHFISNLQPSYQLSPHFWVSGWWCIYWLSMSSLKALFSPLLKWGSACAIFFLSWKNNSSENLFRKEHLPNLPWRKGDLRRKLPLGSVVIGSISNFQSYRRSKCPSMILGLYMHK